MLLPLLIPVLILLDVPVWLALLPALGPIAVMVLFIVRKARTLPEAMKFLVAYLFYNDGIQTVIAVSAIFAAESWGCRPPADPRDPDDPVRGLRRRARLSAGWPANRRQAHSSCSLVIWSAVVIYAFVGMQSTAPVPGWASSSASWSSGCWVR